MIALTSIVLYCECYFYGTITSMKLLTKWFISACALLGADWLIDGIMIESLGTALIIAVFLGFVNAILRPVVIFLTLPITLVTMGLFIFVINGVLFYLLSVVIGDGFIIDGLGAAILGALTVSVFSWMGNRLFIDEQKLQKGPVHVASARPHLNKENVKIYDQED